VLDAFRKTGCTFLMPAGEARIKIKTVIDISHESLMRAWRSLRNWVDEEAQSAKIYRRLADTATLYHEDKAGLYRDPDLQISLSWREESRPNKTWANRYYPGFESAMAFLDQSHEEAIREERQREEARQREVAQAKALALAEQEKADAMQRLAVTQKRRAIFASILSAIAISACIVALIAWKQAKESEEKAILSLVSRQELLQVDVDKALGIMQREDGGLKKFANSMRQKAGSYKSVGDLNSALIAVNAANETDPDHIYSKLFSGYINLELGNHNEAIKNVNTFVEIETQSDTGENQASQWWNGGASIFAQLGNIHNYTNYCNKMFERFRSPSQKSTFERVGKGALMMEAGPRQIEESRDYVLKALEGTPRGGGYYPWFCFAAGLGEYRSNNLKEAERYCKESISNTSQTHLHHSGLNNALLSLIYFKINRQSESLETAEIAKQCLNGLQGDHNNNHDTILIKLLLKERESLGSNNSPEESK